jgi:glycosyltransferase involved in cell wall biosynthesis
VSARTGLRVGIYNLYWHTYGGGEQVSGAIAAQLARHHEVTLLGPHAVDHDATRSRLGVDLTGCGYERVVDDATATAASAGFDLFVNGTFASRAACDAPLGVYYVHFPAPPVSAAAKAMSKASIGAVKALNLAPRLPLRLREVRAGFDRRVVRTEFIPTYQRYLANSAFTATWVQRMWGAGAHTVELPPAVRARTQPGEKRNLIVSVGRFIDPGRGHCKKQLDLVHAFGDLHRSGLVPGWELAVIGGASAPDREYALAVRRAAQGLPVQVLVNAPGPIVDTLLSEASLFWHGAGFEEDEERHPDRFEHFGIAIVEAMAAGAVPIVYGAAGPAEIVRDGVEGRTWRTIGELQAITASLAADPQQRAALAADGARRALDYTPERFERRLSDILADLDVQA